MCSSMCAAARPRWHCGGAIHSTLPPGHLGQSHTCSSLDLKPGYPGYRQSALVKSNGQWACSTNNIFRFSLFWASGHEWGWIWIGRRCKSLSLPCD
jgi:hypothetical protein